ncbi:histidine kinase [Brevibacterium sp.]|uniref:sensor histidine kinase n=1 Tax=Brevibacterium sp. TaxID=1701 RepID=UPI002811E4B2|nr:histidine kinase [Brevibacterium sp.]
MSLVIGVVMWLVCVPLSWMAVIAAPTAFDDSGELNMLGVVYVLLASVLWVSVFVRQRWPMVPYIAGAVLAAAWGDGLLLLVGMFHLIIRAPRNKAIATTIIGSVLIIVGVVRLCFQSPAFNPFGLLFLSDPNQIPGVEASIPADESVFGMNVFTVLAGTIGLAVSVGFGYLLRRTRRMKAVENFADRETKRNESLTAELARKTERELLARELHDTLSHRLSVISLHSGALEVGTHANSEISATAHALGEEARASLEDLRQLVGGVREGNFGQRSTPQPHSLPPNSASLNSLPQLIASVQATGTEVRPSMILQDVEFAPTELHRSVYRIVQEALTNAMKHAPGAPVALTVTVSAAHGATVIVENPLSQPHARFMRPESSSAEANYGNREHLAATGSGTGVVGIRERVRMLGGRATIGPRNGSFFVEVALPPFPLPRPR